MSCTMMSSRTVSAARRGAVRVQAVAKPTGTTKPPVKDSAAQMQVMKRAALSAVAGNMLIAGHAAAATEVASVAGDSRVNLLLTLFVPLAGWVLFNIAGPAKSQLDQMRPKSVAVGLGLAGVLAAGSADAAQEVAMVADQRVNILLTLFVPLAGWVLFNIGGPALNQINQMSDSNKGKDPRAKRGMNQRPGTR